MQALDTCVRRTPWERWCGGRKSSATLFSSVRLRSQSLQKSKLVARAVCSVFLGRQEPSPTFWSPEPTDASPVCSRSSPSHLSTSKVALQPRSARTAPAPPSFIRLPTHIAGFLWHPALVTLAEQPPPPSLRAQSPSSRLWVIAPPGFAPQSAAAPTAFQVHPGLDLFCSSLNPEKWNLHTETLGGWSGGLGMLRSQAWLWSQVEGSFCTREAAATLGKVDPRGEEAPRRGAAAGRSPRQPGGAWAPCGIYSTRSRRRSRS